MTTVEEQIQACIAAAQARRKERAQQRAEFARARAYGLAARYAAKSHRLNRRGGHTIPGTR